MITLLKLKDGTEVIGKVLTDKKDGVVLEDPFIVFYKVGASGNNPSVGMFRYMPFASDPIVYFDLQDIRHNVIPSIAFENYYKSTVRAFEEHMDVEIDKELGEAADYNSSGDRGMQELYKAWLERADTDGLPN
jgi:hypothetical protein